MLKMKHSASLLRSLACGVLIVGMVSNMEAGIVQTVPEPKDDGWYELGDTSRTAASLTSLADFTTLGYIAWGKLAEAGLPSNAKIRFVGGVLLDELPAGYEYDFSNLKYLAYIKASVFPSGYKLTVPAGCYFSFRGANITPDYSAGTFTLAANANESNKGYLCDVEMNGIMTADSNGKPPILGRLTGSGTITINNYWNTQTISGELDFGGILKAANQQSGASFKIESPLAVSHLGTYTGYMSNKALQNVFYFPKRAASDPACTLVITNYTTDATVVAAEESITGGGGLYVYGGNTVEVETFQRGDLFIVADEKCASPTFEKGIGNVVFDQFGQSGQGKIYVSPNINLTANFLSSRTFTVDYSVWKKIVNVCTLDFKAGTLSGDITIKGLNPANLPRKIICSEPCSTASKVVVSSGEWTMPFDFGASDPNEINVARCECGCLIEVPASGTVYVTNATISSSAAYPTRWTEYPVLTCSQGGEEVFAEWTVVPTGNWAKLGLQVEKVVKATGLYVRIRKPLGLMISIY